MNKTKLNKIFDASLEAREIQEKGLKRLVSLRKSLKKSLSMEFGPREVNLLMKRIDRITDLEVLISLEEK